MAESDGNNESWNLRRTEVLQIVMYDMFHNVIIIFIEVGKIHVIAHLTKDIT